MSLKSSSCSSAALYSALCTIASTLRPYFCSNCSSSEPKFTPMRIGRLRALHARTTSLIRSLPPILPGFMRIASTNSATCSAKRKLKWMSATMGSGELFLIRASASASALSSTAQRTMSQPAKYRRFICSSVPSTSFVLEKLIDCTEMGASPPILTEPTEI